MATKSIKGPNSVKGLGAYLPLLRLDRQAAAKALRWSGLGGPRNGRRAVAAFDEDALTVAVEAARIAVRKSGPIAKVVLATTSSPFTERAQAGLLIDALHLPAETRCLDVAGSRRAGVSALLDALLAGDGGDTLIAAGENRPGQAGNALHLAWGDGGAAALVGPGDGARLIGHASLAHDLLDVYASPAHPTPYQSEERFIRDTAVAAVLVPAIGAALEAAAVEAAEIAAAVVHEPVSGCYKAVAAALGLKVPNLAEAVTEAAGDLGTAHVLFALGLALETAKTGDRILLAGFGSGCDALVLEVTGPVAGAGAAAAALAQGLGFADYVRFLSLSGALSLDWGPRSELEQKTSASVLERYGRDFTGFIGGRDAGGNTQFPKTRLPVAPDVEAGPMTDVRLADETGTVVSITADRLNYCPDPPFYFGLIQFPGGARVLMEVTDIAAAPPAVGDALTMRFRVKSADRRRGFRTYFWKAAPVARPQLEA
ncbi:3-oxoacyl-[acyl-carrier-protein] synthase III C-terminal domain-containing protein [Zavarzinia compransoris]|uniref:3-hydroxy-3-methylglutaryl CoA synthase n=1 Tax=Zavarzinia compransoris TaxID=1264899 RepID=A0A317E1U7_9PROT|nr:3-oxoacyl-[acyl-carrier-protein] synthase III C-terminal domain-containing protein [Zavarzinia compransoris]PWR20939.1 3-hydroxy-3-methylglutaryl CoA synthase [Zavarzinia compransoris]TDP43967.1 3-hydroxy-3-methylglutaryl CoA synthase [Zavarzinia compransoris]